MVQGTLAEAKLTDLCRQVTTRTWDLENVDQTYIMGHAQPQTGTLRLGLHSFAILTIRDPPLLKVSVLLDVD